MNRVNWFPYILPESFEGGEPLIPEGWTPFLWADDELHYPQVHPSSVPTEGTIVALLLDQRIVPGDALLTDMLNKQKWEEPKSDGFVEVWLYQTATKKSKIRKVILARYTGLDQHGYPSFTNVGFGTDNPEDTFKGMRSLETYAVAWKHIEIPYLPDVEL